LTAWIAIVQVVSTIMQLGFLEGIRSYTDVRKQHARRFGAKQAAVEKLLDERVAAHTAQNQVAASSDHV
jgi:hypothetical protein